MKLSIVIAILYSSVLFSQFKIPFESRNNVIELTIANSSPENDINFSLHAIEVHEWIKISNTGSEMLKLKPGESTNVKFKFSVDKAAPVNKAEKIKLLVSTPSGESWIKEIAIQIEAPDNFMLYQNYPNPFNPSTIIGFQLPVTSAVSLKVYDILGKEVASLIEGVKEAGYYQQEWNGSHVATGMYVYQLAYKNSKGEREFHRKKMLLTK